MELFNRLLLYLHPLVITKNLNSSLKYLKISQLLEVTKSTNLNLYL